MTEVRIIKTQDRVELTHAEVQAVLKAWIEAQTGRKVDGNISLSARVRGGLESGSQYEASARLLDEVKTPQGN